MKVVLPFLALLMAAGCRNPAPGYTPTPPASVESVKPAEVKTPLALMPLEAGNQWTYTLRYENYQGQKALNSAEVPVVYRVANVRGDGSALVELRQDDKTVDQQVWRSTSDGLYQVASGLKSMPYVPQQPLALLPLTSGRKFSWQGRAPNPANAMVQASMESIILAPQNVDTGLGPLSSVPIETATKYGGGDTVKSTSWFRPGVGLIRIRQETIHRDGKRQILLLTLDNYAVKRQ